MCFSLKTPMLNSKPSKLKTQLNLKWFLSLVSDTLPISVCIHSFLTPGDPFQSFSHARLASSPLIRSHHTNLLHLYFTRRLGVRWAPTSSSPVHLGHSMQFYCNPLDDLLPYLVHLPVNLHVFCVHRWSSNNIGCITVSHCLFCILTFLFFSHGCLLPSPSSLISHTTLL